MFDFKTVIHKSVDYTLRIKTVFTQVGKYFDVFGGIWILKMLVILATTNSLTAVRHNNFGRYRCAHYFQRVYDMLMLLRIPRRNIFDYKREEPCGDSQVL